MSGITSGIGIFSGINSGQLITQLLQIEGRPQQLIQKRALQMQAQQAVFIDLAGKVSAFKTTAASIKDSKVFQALSAASSNQDVLTATADTTATPGSYQFVVDRLVSTQQYLTRGFANRDSTAIGIGTMTVESARGRLDHDVALADLNGGDGVSRGRIVITASSGSPVTVDLSRSATVNEVLESINGSGAAVTASVRDGKFVITDNGGGVVRVENGTGSSTATDLGIAGTGNGTTHELEGTTIFKLGSGTALASFNDGNGVDTKVASGVGAFSFKINIDRGTGPTEVRVNLGDVYTASGNTTTLTEGAVTTVSGALKRMNDALTAAGYTDVRARISSDGTRLEINDASGPTTTITVAENTGTSAKDLGLLDTTSTSTITGKRVLAGLNSTLMSSLNGGAGVTGDGVLNITDRGGNTYALTIDKNSSLDSVMRQMQTDLTAHNVRVRVSLNSKGTGLQLTDTSGSTAGNLIVTGTTGNDTATSLGLSTGATGVASNTVSGTNLQKRYLSRSTLLVDMDNGKGVGTGKFRITDSSGGTALVELTSTDKTLGDVIDKINSRGLHINAQVNANGDGLEIVETGTAGTNKIKIADETGSAAKSLNILGEAAGTGAANKINGSYERTITFAATDTLQQVVTKINDARAGISASIIRDGNGSNPFKLAFSANSTGSAGQVIIDSGSFDLGLNLIDKGQDAKVFYGSSDPARGILVSSSTNTLDNVVNGVRIDLHATSTGPVQLTIARDNAAVETKIDDFITSFNDLIGRIDIQSKYDEKTKKAGALLGDSTALSLRRELYRVVQAKTVGNVGRYDELADVGITIGADGDLKVDKSKLRAAIAEDPSAVQAMFEAKTLKPPPVNVNAPPPREEYLQLGLLGQIDNVTKRYQNSTDGVLTLKQRTLTTQVASLQKQSDAWDVRLAAKRDVLTKQFAAMESTIGNLQTQQSFLSSIG